MSQASLKEWDAALADAEKCVELKPEWAKGYSRLGGARYGKGDYSGAKDAYAKGLELDGANEQLKSGLREAEAALSGGGNGAQRTLVDLWPQALRRRLCCDMPLLTSPPHGALFFCWSCCVAACCAARCVICVTRE